MFIEMHASREICAEENKYRNWLYEILKSKQTDRKIEGFGSGQDCPGG